MRVELIAHTPNPVEVIETAASVCYDSKPSRNGTIMMHCYENGHHSVLEHASFTFKISGISRACSHQLVRHRIGSYSQRSQRYCVENEFDYIVPDKIKNMFAGSIKFGHTMEYLDNCYKSLMNDYGIPAEDARGVLPNACSTTIVVTYNLRSLINFMNLRLCRRSQEEIKTVAQEMRKLILEVDDLFDIMLVPKCERNFDYPFCTEEKTCGKHMRLKDIYRAAMENINLEK